MELESIIKLIAPYIIHALELIGIFIIVVGTGKSFYKYIKTIASPDKNQIKIDFAESVTLALEYKLASEIIKTVTIRSMSELIVLGAVVLIRLILTFVIDWEIKQYDNKNKNKNSKQ
jgi:uncharacterized membrane protein